MNGIIDRPGRGTSAITPLSGGGLLTVHEAVEQIRRETGIVIKARAIYRWVETGRLEGLKLAGSRLYVHSDAVRRMLAPAVARTGRRAIQGADDPPGAC